MIDLRSDTVTTPTIEMREFMMQAKVGDDVFAEDPTINDLQVMICEMLDMEASLFVPSGTQANQIAVNSHTEPGKEVICDYNSHIFNYESGAAALLSGVQLHPLLGKQGHPTVDQIEAAIRPSDDHYPQTALICLENTHNRAGGTIFPLHQIEEISQLANKFGLKMHLDGARLWNASIQTGHSPRLYAKYFDSVSLCFSKGLGSPVGSIIAGTRSFISRAHYFRKAYGGGMRQAGILAAACIYAVENHFERLREDHQNAKHLAEGLNKLPLFDIEMETVQTNIVIASVSMDGPDAYQVCDEMKENDILVIPFGPRKIRFVTHLQINRSDIDLCLKKLSTLFS